MGCYGMGITRIVAAAAEQFHDDAGLRWPKALAPFEAVVIPTNMDQRAVVETAERLYDGLRDRGVEVVLDDRDATAGVKFADADLIGYPIQVVVGTRGLDGGTVDLKLRASGARSHAGVAEGVDAAAALLGEAP